MNFLNALFLLERWESFLKGPGNRGRRGPENLAERKWAGRDFLERAPKIEEGAGPKIQPKGNGLSDVLYLSP